MDMCCRYHGVLQQVLQLAQSAVLVAGVLSLDGFLELPQVRLAVPSITHELEEKKEKQRGECWRLKPGVRHVSAVCYDQGVTLPRQRVGCSPGSTPCCL